MIDKVVEFHGFESLHDYEEELMWALEDFLKENDVSAEFQGTLIVTLDYIEDEENG